jgi:uridine phosphorylase
VYFYILIKHGINGMTQSVELLLSDPTRKSVLTSSDFINHRKRLAGISDLHFPEYCVLSFFPALYRHIKRQYQPRVLDFINKAHPYCLFEYRGIPMGFVFPGIGAPLASAVLDETFALGAETCIFIGSAGVISDGLAQHEWILPVKAVRDEGTSFQYDRPGRYAFPAQDLLETVRRVLHENRRDAREGIIWSTDAVYRETREKINRLGGEGCIAVDMESSALFSVAKHYNKRIVGLLIAGDFLFGGMWRPGPAGGIQSSVGPLGALETAMESLRRFHATLEVRQC